MEKLNNIEKIVLKIEEELKNMKKGQIEMVALGIALVIVIGGMTY